MAIRYVIKEVKMTGRRSVLVIPLVTGKSHNLNTAVEDAVKENIVVVTPAGKNKLHVCVSVYACACVCICQCVCV